MRNGVAAWSFAPLAALCCSTSCNLRTPRGHPGQPSDLLPQRRRRPGISAARWFARPLPAPSRRPARPTRLLARAGQSPRPVARRGCVTTDKPERPWRPPPTMGWQVSALGINAASVGPGVAQWGAAQPTHTLTLVHCQQNGWLACRLPDGPVAPPLHGGLKFGPLLQAAGLIAGGIYAGRGHRNPPPFPTHFRFQKSRPSTEN